MLLSFRSLTAPQRPACLLLPHLRPLGFGAWRQRGEGASMLDLGECVRWTRSFMCDASCIHVYFHALCYMWYMWDMCALYLVIYMTCHSFMLICFASTLYSNSNELYLMYSCLFHILWVWCVNLGHISYLTLLSLLLIAYMNQACWKPHSSLTHTRSGVVIHHQKGEDWKHLGP
jgi:hypothetical protein